MPKPEPIEPILETLIYLLGLENAKVKKKKSPQFFFIDLDSTRDNLYIEETIDRTKYKHFKEVTNRLKNEETTYRIQRQYNEETVERMMIQLID